MRSVASRSGSKPRPEPVPFDDYDAIMARFSLDYLALLDQRVLTIRAYLNAGNATTAQVAMLSLESTSAMAGATALARTVGLLRAALERGDRAAYPELTAAMVREAAAVPALLARGPGPAEGADQGQEWASASR